MKYEDIILSSSSVGYNLERIPGSEYSLRKSNRGFPVSISEKEFDIINKMASKCKNCLEISTGTGISAIALSSCSGVVLSIDSYAEEMHNSYSAYKEKNIVNNNSIDFGLIQSMHKELGINNIRCKIGYSPDDVDRLVCETFGEEKIDLLFIDSGHFDYQLINDFSCSIKYMSNDYKILIHDIHCFSSALEYIQNNTGKKIKIIDGCELNNQAWNLAELI